MAEEPAGKLPPPEVIARRLQELSELYELGKALREVRFLDRPPSSKPDRVRERPDPLEPE